MLQAVIFDFDGIIVDTEPLHHRAFGLLLEPMGMAIPWDEYVEVYMGLDDRGALETVHRRHGRPFDAEIIRTLVDKKASLFQTLLRETPPTPFPGVVELIRALSGRLPLALCSGALRSDIQPVFRALGLESAFDVVVTAEDVERSKPDPACYRLAVERLASGRAPGLVAAHALAIEDTPAGIRAAKGAGLKVLAVTNSYNAGELKQADFVCDSLEGLTPERLAGWMSSARSN